MGRSKPGPSFRAPAGDRLMTTRRSGHVSATLSTAGRPPPRPVPRGRSPAPSSPRRRRPARPGEGRGRSPPGAPPVLRDELEAAGAISGERRLLTGAAELQMPGPRHARGVWGDPPTSLRRERSLRRCVLGRELLVRQLLDVDVAPREHPHAAHEPGRTIHVPHPRVGELELEPHAARRLVARHLHAVREVEAALGLHDPREHGKDVPVLLPEPDLHVVLEALDVLVAHVTAPSASSATALRYRRSYVARSSRYSVIPLKDIRWMGQGPCSAMAARCAGV